MDLHRRWLPGLVVFVIACAALIPQVYRLPQHGDEAQYGWSAAYFGSKVRHVDFSPRGTDIFIDPSWFPMSYWTVTQPMFARYVYATALWVSGAPTPDRPYSFTDRSLQGPETWLTSNTLRLLRFVAVLCSASGLALIVVRLGWPSLLACCLFLSVPFIRADLSRAWAEGPLLLAIGLSVISYGTRWFAPVAGIVAATKLTGLLCWPISYWHGFGASRLRRPLALLITVTTWVMVTPSSWYLLGPVYLLPMLSHRLSENSGQALSLDPTQGVVLAGVFIATRYLWPAILALLLAGCCLLPRLWHHRSPTDGTP